MNAHFPRPDACEPADAADQIDRASVSAVLVMLDARAATDSLSAVAARIIRAQEVTILSLDNEVVEAEWRVLAHAVEIERMADHRYAVIVASQRKRAK